MTEDATLAPSVPAGDKALVPVRRAEPKYQVFVSSTFQDLRSVREAVSWEILKSGHIPVGMENFSAYDDRGWRVIERTIDTSDYYVLILAGRYGSIDEASGIGWTHREYRYAVSRGVPVLAFVRDRGHVSGADIDTGDKATRLDAFIDEVSRPRVRELWTTQDDLRARVSLALLKSIHSDALDDRRRPGWYRGDQLPAPAASTLDEIARLSAENRELRARVEDLTQQSEPVFVLSRADREQPIRDIRPHRPSIAVVRERRATSERAAAGGDYDVEGALSRMFENDPLIARELASPSRVRRALDLIDSTYVLRLDVRNVGNRVARDVTVRFVVEGASRFTRVIRGSTGLASVSHMDTEAEWADPEAEPLGAKEPVRAATTTSTDARSRTNRMDTTQHIPLLGLGMTVSLVPMRLHVAALSAPDWKMHVQFIVDSARGGRTEGSFSIVPKRATIESPRKHLVELARAALVSEGDPSRPPPLK